MLESLKAGLRSVRSRLFVPGKTRGVLACALLAVFFSLFLLTQTDLRNTLADFVDDATKGTPLEGAGRHIRSDGGKITPSVTGPVTEGTEFRGSAGDGSGMPEGSYTREGKNIVGRVLEDSNLRKDFIWDLATFLAGSYSPKPSPSLCTVQDFNAYLGGRINIAAHGGRSSMMRYVFQPTMLHGLYHLYVEYLFDVLAYQLGKKYTDEEIRAFYEICEQRVGDTARAVTAILSIPDVGEHLESYEKCSDALDSINAQIAVASYDVNQIAEDSPDRVSAELALETLRGKAANATLSRDEALRAMVAAVGIEQNDFLTDETLLFFAQWIKRRLDAGESGDEALRSAVQILYDLEVRFRHKAEAQGDVPADGKNGSPATLVQDGDMKEEKAKPGKGDTSALPKEDALPAQEKQALPKEDEQPAREKEALPKEDEQPAREKQALPKENESRAREKPALPKEDELPAQKKDEKGEPTPDDGLPMTIQIPIAR